MFDKVLGLFGKKSGIKFSGNVPSNLAAMALPLIKAKSLEEITKRLKVAKFKDKILKKLSLKDLSTNKGTCRAIIYHVFSSFVNSGEVADLLRDSVDDKVWDLVSSKIADIPANSVTSSSVIYDYTVDSLIEIVF